MRPDPDSTDARVVLSDADIARALKRIAHEILEGNKGASDLVLLGIPSRGVILAQRLAEIISEVEGSTDRIRRTWAWPCSTQPSRLPNSRRQFR